MALEVIRHLAMALEGIRHLPMAPRSGAGKKSGVVSVARGYHYAFLLYSTPIPNRPGVLTRWRKRSGDPRDGESVLGIREMAKAFWGSADLGKSPLRADANRGSSNVGFAKRERRRVQNLILSESVRRILRESPAGLAKTPARSWPAEPRLGIQEKRPPGPGPAGGVPTSVSRNANVGASRI